MQHLSVDLHGPMSGDIHTASFKHRLRVRVSPVSDEGVDSGRSGVGMEPTAANGSTHGCCCHRAAANVGRAQYQNVIKQEIRGIGLVLKAERS